MKKILIILAALLTHVAAEDEARQAVSLPVVEDKRPWPDVPVSKIDLTSNQTVNDAVKQIIAGLPPEGRMALVVEVPEAELAAMPLTGDLKLRNVPIGIALRYLERISPVGFRLWNNAWHIGSKRQDDVIAAEYKISENTLEQLGIVVGPNQSFMTKKGREWPPESYWSATYTSLVKAKDPGDVDALGRPTTETGLLRVLAARSYQDEISAVLLLWERGHPEVSLDR
jgi:hypothetical protein